MSRRTVTRTAAWSVPVIAATAATPAFAASLCSTFYSGTLDWGNTSQYNATNNTFTVTPTGTSAITGTVASVFNGYAAATGNLGTTASIGGTTSTGLNVLQNAVAAANANNPTYNQTVTIHFSRPIYSVSFLVTDIDASASSPATYTDGVAMFAKKADGSAATVARVATTGSTVTGSGLSTSSPATNNASYTNAQNGGNTQFTMAGPITDIVMVYWNVLANTNGTQYTYIAPISFTTHAPGASC